MLAEFWSLMKGNMERDSVKLDLIGQEMSIAPERLLRQPPAPVCSVGDFYAPQEIYVSTCCLQRMVLHGESYSHAEVGGVLVGRICRDETTMLPFVELVDFLPSKSIGTSVHFTLKAEEMVEFDRLLLSDPRYHGLYQVGWFHTHPGLTVFLSGTDKNTHENYYPLDWQVAVVLDPRRKDVGFFYRATGKYGLYPRIHLYQWAAEPVAFDKTGWTNYLKSVTTLHEAAPDPFPRGILFRSEMSRIAESTTVAVDELPSPKLHMPTTFPDVSRGRETAPSRPGHSVDFRLGLLLLVYLIGAGLVFLMGFYAAGRILQGKPTVQIPERVTVSMVRDQETDAVEFRKMESTVALQSASINQLREQVAGLIAIQSRWTPRIEENSNRGSEFIAAQCQPLPTHPPCRPTQAVRQSHLANERSDSLCTTIMSQPAPPSPTDAGYKGLS